ITAYGLACAQSNRDRWMLIIAAAFAAAITVVTFSLGTKEIEQLEPDFARQTERHGPWVTKTSLDVIYRASVNENLSRTRQHGFTNERILDHLIFLVVSLAPIAALAVNYSRRRDRPHFG